MKAILADDILAFADSNGHEFREFAQPCDVPSGFREHQ